MSSYPGNAKPIGNFADPNHPALAAQIELSKSLGPCPVDGGLHDLRSHYKTSSLVLSILFWPLAWCFLGRRRAKHTVCIKCNTVWDNVPFPSP